MISTALEVDALIDANAPIVICVSGGKDSRLAAEQATGYARSRGHRGSITLVYSDLGEVVWADAREQCERLATRLDIPLQVVRREAGGLMERWEKRWADNVERYVALSCVKLILPWSTPSMRFCTSELKTSIIQRWIRKTYNTPVVCVLGIRRDEGNSAKSGRGAAPIFKRHETKQGKKPAMPEGSVDWNPIVEVKTTTVVQIMRTSGDIPSSYQFNAERFSCVYCMMATVGDHQAGARDPRNHSLYRRQCNLEITSTFSFQGNRWLSDIAPHLLSEHELARLAESKTKAKQREAIEAVIPNHLLYVKGWPTQMPTFAEAQMLAQVRREMGEMMGFQMQCTDAVSVLNRYAELMAINEERKQNARDKAARESAKGMTLEAIAA